VPVCLDITVDAASLAGSGGVTGLSADVTWDAGYTEAPDEGGCQWRRCARASRAMEACGSMSDVALRDLVVDGGQRGLNLGLVLAVGAICEPGLGLL
jgi:hypothetical protein